MGRIGIETGFFGEEMEVARGRNGRLTAGIRRIVSVGWRSASDRAKLSGAREGS